MSQQTVLTEKFILQKSRASNLSEVRRLNLWGEGFSDVSIIRELENVEVIAMASNQISSLQSFTHCKNLEELYLRKNNVTNLREVAALSGLRKLHTLWLMDNPCAKHPYYREFVLHCCLRLKHLDEIEVTAEERVKAAHRLTPRVIDEILERVPVVPYTSNSNPESNQNQYNNEDNNNNNINNNNNNSNNTDNNANIDTNRCRQNYSEMHAESLPPPPSSAEHYSVVQEYININDNRENDNANSNVGQTNLDEDEVGSVGTVVFTTVQAQRAMLTAIVSLLPELTVESLELLRHEVSERIERIKSQLS